MKKKGALILSVSLSFLLFPACTKDYPDDNTVAKSYLDTLIVYHSMKGWELYSWPQGNKWNFSVLVGTNSTKTYEEVISYNHTDTHLITICGTDSLKMVLAKFPENEYITWIGDSWLQSCWSTSHGNLQLPSQVSIEEITQYCNQRKLNLQVTK
jgi:hypothetical protein